MKNAIIEYLSCYMMVVMILFLMTAPVVSACASGRKTDSVTGWTFSSPSTYTHAGTKSLTYYYGDSYGESYHTRFTEGKNLWGTNINLQRSTNSDTANHKGRKSVSAIFERRACYDTTKKMASAAVSVSGGDFTGVCGGNHRVCASSAADVHRCPFERGGQYFFRHLAENR